MADWRLRRAGEGDAPALSLVAGASFLETFAGILAGPDIVTHCAAKSSTAAFAAWLADDRCALTLAETNAGHAPIGYAVVTPPDLPVDTDDRDLELRRIYALSRFHGGGLGAALMADAIEGARERGAERLLLGVYGGNTRAHRFYERQGFTIIGTRRFLVGATWHDDFIYGRSL
ncbi:ribosomal protein S18 acetylase RimI-like enzyme [Sphingomonas jinjuensis]|uniref:Ribosomal protein S18 acetylase RimI-like enzyme n=1 Tax=Sphingomonas jinjuensis TaxID=535907 RepID=A0A840FBQ1_9SPHN|nr:GNAT family N-acetyltransferase [Sphingomonas jinjuensis]MBB4154072.1 ribosomal protein S18 acetylase RimI-like enzyme [Sphingomonas jinjuensis]